MKKEKEKLGKWWRRGYGRWQSPASEKIKINKKQ